MSTAIRVVLALYFWGSWLYASRQDAKRRAKDRPWDRDDLNRVA